MSATHNEISDAKKAATTRNDWKKNRATRIHGILKAARSSKGKHKATSVSQQKLGREPREKRPANRIMFKVARTPRA